MKDVKFEVTNTDKGVIIIITSDNPEVVKLIQDRWAKRAKNQARRHEKGEGEEGHGSGKHGNEGSHEE